MNFHSIIKLRVAPLLLCRLSYFDNFYFVLAFSPKVSYTKARHQTKIGRIFETLSDYITETFINSFTSFFIGFDANHLANNFSDMLLYLFLITFEPTDWFLWFNYQSTFYRITLQQTTIKITKFLYQLFRE